MENTQVPFLQQKSSSAQEPNSYLQDQFNKTYLEYGNLDAMRAAYGLSDLNDRMSELKNIKQSLTGKKTSMSADMLRLEFPEIAERISGDGYYEDYARIAKRVKAQRDYEKIIQNSPDTFTNKAAVFSGSVAGGVNMADVGISAIAAASGLPFLAPFSNIKYAAGLNFATSNLIENIVAEPITMLSKSIDKEDYTAVDSVKNILMGTLSSQAFYIGSKLIKAGTTSAYSRYFAQKQIAQNLVDMVNAEASGKKFISTSETPPTKSQGSSVDVSGRVYYAPLEENSYLGGFLPEGVRLVNDNVEAVKLDTNASKLATYEFVPNKVVDGDSSLEGSGIRDLIVKHFGEDFYEANKGSKVWQMVEGFSEGYKNGSFSSPLSIRDSFTRFVGDLKASGYDGIAKDMSDSNIPSNGFMVFGADKIKESNIVDNISKTISTEEAKTYLDEFNAKENNYTYTPEADKFISNQTAEYKIKTFSENTAEMKSMIDDVDSLEKAGILSKAEAERFKSQHELANEALSVAKALTECMVKSGEL